MKSKESKKVVKDVINKKNQLFYFPKRIEVKIYGFMLVLGILSASIFFSGITSAYLSDTEKSEGNLFTASNLDLSIDLIRSDGFRTQTPGGWGSEVNGDNPGTYRYENFPNAFPDGVVIGLEEEEEEEVYFAKFFSSESIENFLPIGGKSGKFTQNHIDPTYTEAGILAGHTLALSLNVGFDDFDPDFGVNETRLGDFYANSEDTLCSFMTVDEVLSEANIILSGGESDFSPSEINSCATEINESFIDGEQKKLSLGDTVQRNLDIKNKGKLDFQYKIKLEQVSGDPDFCLYLQTEVYLEDDLVYSGDLFSFESDIFTFSSTTDNWEFRNIGMVGDPPGTIQEKTCGYNYIVNGWQMNFADPTNGFFDEEIVEDTIYSGTWIKEVVQPLANPDTTTTTPATTSTTSTTLVVLGVVNITTTTTTSTTDTTPKTEEDLPTTTTTPEVLTTSTEFVLPPVEEPLIISTTSTEFVSSTEEIKEEETEEEECLEDCEKEKENNGKGNKKEE
jgi:predicted ribosomally synthesized peptide with SipW-like signal peptide